MDKARNWFETILRTEFQTSFVPSQGSRLEVRRRTVTGTPTNSLLLAHGYLANAHWWDAVVALLPPSWNVVAFSFAGMGHSEWRKSYSPEQDVADVFTVLEWAEFDSPPWLVGHSYGGGVATLAMKKEPTAFDRLILVDMILKLDDESHAVQERRERKFYPDKASTLAKFRLLPNQPIVHPELVSYIGERSIKKFDRPPGQNAWSWSFDFGRIGFFPEGGKFWITVRDEFLDLPEWPLFIRGALSQLCPDSWADVYRRKFGSDAELVTIDGAYHHVILDRPDTMVSVLKSLKSETRIRTY